MAAGAQLGPGVFQQAAARVSAGRKVFLRGPSLGKATGLGTQGTSGGERVAHVVWATVLLQPVVPVSV